MGLTRGDSRIVAEVIPWRGEDWRHGPSGGASDGLLGGRASASCGVEQACEPEPAASVAGCGSGRHEPDASGADRRHGPSDAARLGASLQRAWAGWAEGQLGERLRSSAVVVRWRRVDLQPATTAFSPASGTTDSMRIFSRFSTSTSPSALTATATHRQSPSTARVGSTFIRSRSRSRLPNFAARRSRASTRPPRGAASGGAANRSAGKATRYSMRRLSL